ncbi:MAG: hypothetical protein AAGD34_19535 [Pseudomonadota bacterium]
MLKVLCIVSLTGIMAAAPLANAFALGPMGASDPALSAAVPQGLTQVRSHPAGGMMSRPFSYHYTRTAVRVHVTRDVPPPSVCGNTGKPKAAYTRGAIAKKVICQPNAINPLD